MVCGCIVHKMGMCRWNRRAYEEEASVGNSTETQSCVHVIDLPPTYEAATKVSSSVTKPPPSYEIACSKETMSGESSSAASVHHI